MSAVRSGRSCRIPAVSDMNAAVLSLVVSIGVWPWNDVGVLLGGVCACARRKQLTASAKSSDLRVRFAMRSHLAEGH